MLEHTIEEIQGAENLFRTRQYPVCNTAVAGRTIVFYTLPPGLNPDLPDFVCRFTNEQAKRYVLGVSSSIPDSLRPYSALAEYIEFVELGIRKKGRVEFAERETLKHLRQPAKQRDYIDRKIRLYEAELRLDEEDPAKYALGEEGRAEFEQAIAFLKASKVISP